ncbi:hypothetical protein A4D02_07780 [Niastella koreensis]|uniref:Uncharacterized protein n=2 Tax=Niastella koreensis TaxID=354356 RepID=G8TL54_NIAKG|nr:hypothetical protein [Niastella koreensis]AEW01895.1 hypothetical protein Niako_5663 [Niastella koreensis GR20-10]OQP48599.1 hypothetical protein A4D02_07780 [Niastella koreensis]
MNKFLLQLWLSVRIWLVAVAVNTLLGTGFLSDFKLHAVADLAIIGVCLGGFFSFPIMLVICLVINTCARADIAGMRLLKLLFITNIILATIAFMVFCGGFNIGKEMVVLLCTAIISGTVAIAIFYKSILKWGGDYNNTQQV